MINIYSSVHLEPWNQETPLKKGIGGSETCHVELVKEFESMGIPVMSYAPIPPNEPKPDNWKHFSEANPKDSGNWLVFRDAGFFDQELNPNNNYTFVAQDVDYPWNPERLEKITNYIVLCNAHKRFTEHKYPQLKGKIKLSSNGVRDGLITKIESERIPRNPNKLVWTSSPDRGLELLLTNWFRVLEHNPKAEVHVFYGFNNIEVLGQKLGGWYAQYPQKLHQLMHQPGVVFRGRVNQEELYRELFSANIWWYPTNWPETSCINCMDAQACGAIPVTNNYWAMDDNILHGYVSMGIPQSIATSKIWQIDKVAELMKNPEVPWRNQMMQDARKHFSWTKIAKQYLEILNVN